MLDRHVTTEPANSYKSFLARSLVTLVIPQGYTLSIAGSFAIAVHRYGFPFDPDVWAFVASAVVAFVALAVIAQQSVSRGLANWPIGLLGLANVVPLGVVLAASAVVAITPSPELGFVLTGVVAAGGYVLLVSLYFWLVAQGEPRQQQ